MGKLNSLERTIGLEFEFSNPKMLNDPDVEELMKAVGPEWVRDGSLPQGGKELVTAPMQGDHFIEGISAIVALISTLKPEINAKCGYHVHVGAKDLGWHNIRNIILAWCAIERDIFGKLVQKERSRNHYCIPLRASGEKGLSQGFAWQMNKASLQELAALPTMTDIENYLVRRFYNTTSGSRDHQMQMKNKRAAGEGTGCFRYSALNLHSWWYRQTLEFRLKEGTLDLADCINWPLFCGWFVENVAHMTLEDVKKITGLMGYLSVVKMPRKLKDWVTEKIENPPVPVVEEIPPPQNFFAVREGAQIVFRNR